MTDPINMEAVAWRWRLPGMKTWTVSASPRISVADVEVQPLYAAPPLPAVSRDDVYLAVMTGGDAVGITDAVMALYDRAAPPAVSVEDVARIIRDECFEVRDGELQGSTKAAARIIEQFKGRA